MRDPLEGLTADGLIRTGAHRDRIPDRYSAVLHQAVERIHADTADAAIYLYGSVATGVARAPDSDVDLLTFGLPAESAIEISRQLSVAFVDVCRGVEIAAASTGDLDGDDDESYGNRVFLHHYCVRLAGPKVGWSGSGFRGDRRVARGFNGDIAQHVTRWRCELESADDGQLGRRVARKTLLAVAGLVSVHDATWTTDRAGAAARWQHVHPELARGLDDLLGWSAGHPAATSRLIAGCLDTTVDPIVEQFAASIGLWPDRRDVPELG
jgi:hypothetical protein